MIGDPKNSTNGVVTISDVEPIQPQDGALWFDTSSNGLKVYIQGAYLAIAGGGSGGGSGGGISTVNGIGPDVHGNLVLTAANLNALSASDIDGMVKTINAKHADSNGLVTLTAADLSAYTTQQVDTALALKADKSDLAAKADVGDSYTKAQADSKFETKTQSLAKTGDLSSLTTTDKGSLVEAINEIDAKPTGGGGGTSVSVATNVEADAGTNNTRFISPKVLKHVLDPIKSSVTTKANAADVYTKTQADAKYAAKTALNSKAATADVGDKTALTTTAKGSLVEAINEVNAKPSGGTGTAVAAASQAEVDAGTVANKYVSPKTLKSISDQVSETNSHLVNVSRDVGNVQGLTTAQHSLVDAINALEASAGGGASVTVATNAEADAGTNNTKFISPKALKHVADPIKASIPAVATTADITAGTSLTKFVNPKELNDIKNWLDTNKAEKSSVYDHTQADARFLQLSGGAIAGDLSVDGSLDAQSLKVSQSGKWGLAVEPTGTTTAMLSPVDDRGNTIHDNGLYFDSSDLAWKIGDGTTGTPIIGQGESELGHIEFSFIKGSGAGKVGYANNWDNKTFGSITSQQIDPALKLVAFLGGEQSMNEIRLAFDPATTSEATVRQLEDFNLMIKGQPDTAVSLKENGGISTLAGGLSWYVMSDSPTDDSGRFQQALKDVADGHIVTIVISKPSEFLRASDASAEFVAKSSIHISTSAPSGGSNGDIWYQV
ncbi:hypothetical protein [Vibrio breoganii]|uniref:hypothetical protein n=1 Tax=Vibrio breoganii TaxID=553239 RepID=UPI000C835D98|nr:hypothetical protein [Vibrio breoganii]PMK30659.1 hypothetical protein BCU03_09595 [Vibrio breoganii]